MTVPSMNNNHGLDTSDLTAQASAAATVPNDDQGAPVFTADETELLQLATEAESQAVSYLQSNVRANWARSYRAFRNQHSDGSKYHKPEYKARSKVFRPKTRSAVRRGMAAAANALFANGDVVGISAQNDSQPYQQASAAIKQELLNYRLDRKSRRNGIRWFTISMGARQDAFLTGICISKQTWRFRQEVVDEATEESINGDGEVISAIPEKKVTVEDRPDVQLIPPENVVFDPNCDWTNPMQTSRYVIVNYPMAPGDVLDMIEASGEAGDVKFVPITETELISIAGNGAQDSIAPRTARSGGTDATQQMSGKNGVVWVSEVFIRHRGRDWNFWMVNKRRMISKPVATRKAYPAFAGDRPLVIGFGALEAHQPLPMSPVESWQPLQQEVNDQVNLRLDHMKRAVAPPSKVKRGAKVDLQQVQRNGPNGVIMVNAMEDVDFQRIPDMPQSAFVENNYLNSDFDDLAGTFGAGSVQTNRSLNETVGGMKMMKGDSQQMGEFDLSVWVETWVEPVLWQLLKLEEMYEDDETVLIIAGEKAKLYEKFGMDAVTDHLLMAETNLTVKIGHGAATDPQEKLGKLGAAAKMVGDILTPFVEAGVIKPPKPRVAEWVDTIFGAAGFQDGGARFFENIEEEGQQAEQPQQPQPDPAAIADAQAKQADTAIKGQRLQLDAKKHSDTVSLRQLDLQTGQQEVALRMQDSERSRVAAASLARERSMAEIGRALIDRAADRRSQHRQHAHETTMGAHDGFSKLLMSKLNHDARASQMTAKGQAANVA